VGWTVEDELLVCCSRLTIDSITQEKVKGILNSALDEDYFVRICIENGVEGLAYHNLKKMSADSSFNHRRFRDLEEAYYYNLANNMSLLHLLQMVLERLRRKNIPVILLRGAALLDTVYGNPGLRPMDDIDLLVRDRDLRAVRESLIDLGFLSTKNYPNVFGRGRAALDIHTDIANFSRIRARKYAVGIKNDEIWTDAIPINPPENSVLILSPYDTIITLSVHMLKHSYNGLIWFVDVNEIIEKYRDNLDWSQLLSRAEEFNVQKPLYYTFLYLKEVMNTHIPAGVLAELEPHSMNYFERHIMRLVLDNQKVNRLGDLLFLFNITGGGEKLRFIFENCFPRSEIMHQIFNLSNPCLSWLSYPLRFFQLLFIGTKMSLRLMQKVSRGRNERHRAR